MSGPNPPRAARSLPATPNLEQQKKQARELLGAARSGSATALARFRIHPRLVAFSDDELRTRPFSLHEAQLVLAREYGFATWARLKAHINDGGSADAEVCHVLKDVAGQCFCPGPGGSVRGA